ncbi:hypothetical protein RSAG8_11707, partial [Rhizoctonia solani AG-8 WAC10335]
MCINNSLYIIRSTNIMGAIIRTHIKPRLAVARLMLTSLPRTIIDRIDNVRQAVVIDTSTQPRVHFVQGHFVQENGNRSVNVAQIKIRLQHD